jgi:hypothetical protein
MSGDKDARELSRDDYRDGLAFHLFTMLSENRLWAGLSRERARSMLVGPQKGLDESEVRHGALKGIGGVSALSRFNTDSKVRGVGVPAAPHRWRTRGAGAFAQVAKCAVGERIRASELGTGNLLARNRWQAAGRWRKDGLRRESVQERQDRERHSDRIAADDILDRLGWDPWRHLGVARIPRGEGPFRGTRARSAATADGKLFGACCRAS